ncbi:MAG TPA: SH3 domain-containing protein [bacterium]|nr:SH3 domain-containing protein [bacterium]HPJ73001.1 SH3 domain-containing protein [bacterium]HPQ65623.1 SH3 domain-containing protein [bacterium]
MKGLIVGGALAAAVLSAGSAAADLLNIQVREAQIRERPSFLGKIVATLNYGDRVSVTEESQGWSLVSLPGGRKGWVHSSALTDEEIEIKAGGSNVGTGATADELALAGKGFNSDIEAEFKERNREIDFTWIDRMEKFVVTPEQMERFLREGGVTMIGGGAR